MGDFYPDPKNPGKWIYDEQAPTPGQNPAVTMMLPVIPVKPSPKPRPYPDPGVVSPQAPAGFEHEDGTVYARAEPGWFETYDDVDSRTIDDPGAPQ